MPHFIIDYSANLEDEIDLEALVECVRVAAVARGGVDDIDRAAKAAHTAFPAWRAMKGDDRKALLHKIADAIEARSDEIAILGRTSSRVGSTP